jgi:hypothetical protein
MKLTLSVAIAVLACACARDDTETLDSVRERYPTGHESAYAHRWDSFTVVKSKTQRQRKPKAWERRPDPLTPLEPIDRSRLAEAQVRNLGMFEKQELLGGGDVRWWIVESSEAGRLDVTFDRVLSPVLVVVEEGDAEVGRFLVGRILDADERRAGPYRSAFRGSSAGPTVWRVALRSDVAMEMGLGLNFVTAARLRKIEER